MGAMAAIAVASYLALRHYSPFLVGYVVEQTLLQKAPDGADRDKIRRSFREWLEASPDGRERLARLFAMSQQLEKVQKLSNSEIAELLKQETGSPLIRR
jgi:hypothetical protein